MYIWFGLKTYFVCRPKINKEKVYTKSLIVQQRMRKRTCLYYLRNLKTRDELEIILIYATQNNTEIASYQMKKNIKS